MRARLVEHEMHHEDRGRGRPRPYKLAVSVALVASAACTITPSANGRPCDDDNDCGTGFYCQVEAAPQVCIPGALGLPELPNFPPRIERAIVVIPIGLPGETILVHEGDFAARDPEGDDDGITFAMADIDREGPLGRLDVDELGHWTFTLAEPVPEAEALATHTLQAIDALGNVGVAQALVVVTPQPPSEFLMYWVGSGGPGNSAPFTDASQWNPSTRAPDADTSVAVGPGADGDMTLDADVEVFGWLSNDDATVATENHVVTARGTRILSDTPSLQANGGTARFVAAPVGNFDFEVQLGGLLPSLELQSPARAIGQLHVAGDLALVDGGQNNGVLRLEADLSVDGSVVQSPEGPALLMQGGLLRTGGDLVLTGNTKSVITAGLLDVGGALDAPDATFGGPDLLVRFAGGSAAEGRTATVRLPESARIGNAAIARNSAVAFTTELVIEGTLQVSGGVRVAAPVVVDTLVLRPSFVDLGTEGEGASLTARACFIAPFIARPSWLTCDVEDIVPPLDRPDGGPDVEPPPDPGPPSVCTRLNADVVKSNGGIAGIANDNMEHGLIVVNAGGDAVTDRFAFDGLALDEVTGTVRGGSIEINDDGSYTFAPNTIAGVEGLDIAMDVGIRNDDGTELVAGTQEACVDLQIIDTTGMNVMIGFSWDDPAAWTFGRVPTSTDRVFIPASDRPRVAGPTGGELFARELYVSSGAVLYTGARTMRVADVVLVGGTLDAPVVIGPPTRETSAVGGRIAAADASLGLGASSAALVCGGGTTRLVADVDTATLRSEQPCSFNIGQNRFTARDDVNLEQALGLRMNDSAGAVVFEGDLTASALGGVGSFLNRGELQFRGFIDVGAWLTPAAPEHRAYIIGEGDILLDELEYNGTLNVNADSEGSLTITNGGHVNNLFSLRHVELGAELFVETLIMNPQFDTSTPDLFRVEECSPQPQHEACLNPPD